MYGSFIRISMPVSPGAFVYPGAHNHRRPHSALGMMTPVAFAAGWREAHLTAAPTSAELG